MQALDVNKFTYTIMLMVQSFGDTCQLYVAGIFQEVYH